MKHQLDHAHGEKVAHEWCSQLMGELVVRKFDECAEHGRESQKSCKVAGQLSSRNEKLYVVPISMLLALFLSFITFYLKTDLTNYSFTSAFTL